MKTYKLKKDPEKDCFICGGKVAMSFDLESLKFIQTLTLCQHHKQTTEIAVKKFDREPGQEG